VVGDSPVDFLRLGAAARDSCNPTLHRVVTPGRHEVNTPTALEPVRNCKGSPLPRQALVTLPAVEPGYAGGEYRPSP
jgi:hypothetical protein